MNHKMKKYFFWLVCFTSMLLFYINSITNSIFLYEKVFAHIGMILIVLSIITVKLKILNKETGVLCKKREIIIFLIICVTWLLYFVLKYFVFKQMEIKTYKNNLVYLAFLIPIILGIIKNIINNRRK